VPPSDPPSFSGARADRHGNRVTAGAIGGIIMGLIMNVTEAQWPLSGT
jgi:hypothetical protein